VTRTTRRYWAILGLGLGFISGWVLGANWLITVGATRMFQATVLIGVAAFVAAAYFVARQKGRSPAWVVLALFAPPSLVVLLLLPYDSRRRAVLNDGKLSGELDAWRGL